ncbi:MAG: DNA-binding response regulator [Kordiimonas sp.]|nr:DNA-binding response regulator [Kordiimonas sp.]|tara:strand:- start:2647 stop:3339 length:693 start_codon:yes stop_codon:yes gene_type:complete
MRSYHILLVDDDNALRQTLADQLNLHEEFTTMQAEDGANAIATAKKYDFDLILLDIGLPDLDGREVCRMLRRANINIPILMLTANDSEADTILGLDAGANDYVTKPFNFGVLLARMRAHLRQYAQSEDASFMLGPYIFKPAEKILYTRDEGQKIRLTEKETAILKFLIKAGGAPVGRDILLHDVWGYNDTVTTHTLETHIYRLRQKIEQDPSNAQLLLTDAGGYRLAGLD